MTLNGIDVSNWQPTTVCRDVAYEFAIIKATEGTSYVDPHCDGHYQAAKARGKCVGVYHFSRADLHPGTAGAQAEAEYFVKNITGYVGNAVLILDHEAKSAAQGGPAWAKAFLDTVKNLTKVTPVIYGSRSAVCTSTYTEIAQQYPLWVAAYGINNTHTTYAPETDHGQVAPWTAPTIFQYTSNGHLPNYSAALDINVFYGTATDWQALAAKATQPPAPAPAPAPQASPTLVLKPGSTGVAVKQWQIWLRSTFPAYKNQATIKALTGGKSTPLAVDGSYGKITEAWTKEFQRRLGITQDGVRGPDTLNHARQYGYTGA